LEVRNAGQDSSDIYHTCLTMVSSGERVSFAKRDYIYWVRRGSEPRKSPRDDTEIRTTGSTGHHHRQSDCRWFQPVETRWVIDL